MAGLTVSSALACFHFRCAVSAQICHKGRLERLCVAKAVRIDVRRVSRMARMHAFGLGSGSARARGPTTKAKIDASDAQGPCGQGRGEASNRRGPQEKTTLSCFLFSYCFFAFGVTSLKNGARSRNSHRTNM